MLRRPQTLAFGALGLSLCASSPPSEGTEATLAAGAGQYTLERGGCGTPVHQYRIVEPAAYGRVQGRNQAGWTAVAEASLTPGLVTEGVQTEAGEPDPNAPAFSRGDWFWVGTGMLRGGWHGQHLGVAIGAGIVVDDTSTFAVPSGEIWFGQPEVFYLWGSLLAGPSTNGPSLWNRWVGLGHKSEGARATLGANNQGVRVTGAVPSDDLWIGGQVAVGSGIDGADGPDLQGLVKVSIPLQ